MNAKPLIQDESNTEGSDNSDGECDGSGDEDDGYDNSDTEIDE